MSAGSLRRLPAAGYRARALALLLLGGCAAQGTGEFAQRYEEPAVAPTDEPALNPRPTAPDEPEPVPSSVPEPSPAPTSPTVPGSTLPVLLTDPLVFAPTPYGFGLNAVLTSGDPTRLFARVRVEGTESWSDSLPAEARALDVAEWKISGLESGTRYEYELGIDGEFEAAPWYDGLALTARPPGSSFGFAIISDSHIGANLDYSNQGVPEVLQGISAQIDLVGPDFLVNLGDILDFHQFGFNPPIPSAEIARQAYVNYRTLLGSTQRRVAHFPVIGNWDGENGHYTAEEIERARSQRVLYLPGPNAASYPEGGGPGQDYYAFTWGDALFVVLNVMSYTPTAHLLSTDPGLPDDWTLGQEQLEWLSETLTAATSKWRFLFIHHTVGGAAGNDIESAYGRGGGQAAYVGEQAVVHQLMMDHGVQIFFYGHDHVFTDMVVDGIHYTMPSAAGAPWVFDESQTGYTEYWIDSGWAAVDVTPETVAVRFINEAGEALYEYAVQ